MKSVAIFGSSKLGQKAWRPGKRVWSIAIFGGDDLDFREAELEEDVTRVVAIAIFGGIKITVAEDTPVALSGFSFMGGREVKRSRAKETPAASAKALHVNAFAIFGACTVTEYE